MERGDGFRTSRVLGRSIQELFALGRQLERSLLPEAPQQRPVESSDSTSTQVLGVGDVSFEAHSPVRFPFAGYAQPSPGGERADPAQRQKLAIPRMDEIYQLELSHLLQNYQKVPRENAFANFEVATSAERRNKLAGHLWKLLRAMTQVHRTPNVPLVIHLLAGARRWLEMDFREMIRKSVATNTFAQPTGRETDVRHLYLSFVRIGPLDLNTLMGPPARSTADTTLQLWRALYTALRAGDIDAVEKLSERLVFPAEMTTHSPVRVLRLWRSSGGRLPLPVVHDLISMCHNMMYRTEDLDPVDHYIIRSVTFLCAHLQTMERLMTETGMVWDSLEEFLWFHLGCVRYIPIEAGRWIFSLKDFQQKINVNSERLVGEGELAHSRYVSALICSLQFKKALKYLLDLQNRQDWYVHVVHLAVALEYSGLLDLGGEMDEKAFSRVQISEILNSYAASFRDAYPSRHFEYRFFVNKIMASADQSLEKVMVENIVERLVQDQQPNLGLSLESARVIESSASQMQRPKELFHAVATSLKSKGYLEHAYKCFHEGGFKSEALQTINELIASKLTEMLTDKVSKRPPNFIPDCTFVRNQQHVAVLFNLFSSFKEGPPQIQGSELRPLHVIEREQDELRRVGMMLEAYHGLRFDAVLREFENLSYIPKVGSNLEVFAKELSEKFPLHLAMLHKTIALFCKALIRLVREQRLVLPADDRRTRLDVYQRLLLCLPETYTSKTEASNALAEASSALATLRI